MRRQNLDWLIAGRSGLAISHLVGLLRCFISGAIPVVVWENPGGFAVIALSCKGSDMGDGNNKNAPGNSYLTTDDDRDAVGALEMTAHFLELAEQDPQRMWKWTIIALHNAIQGFMALNLRGTWNVGTLRREQRTKKLKAQQAFYAAKETGDEEAAEAANNVMLWSDEDLETFNNLYSRIKDPNGAMRQYVHSRIFEPRENDDQNMEFLNDIRNKFMHYVPHIRRRFILADLAEATEVGLHVITFLLNDSGNILWVRGNDRQGLKPRADDALRRANEAVARLQAAYSEPPRP